MITMNPPNRPFSRLNSSADLPRTVPLAIRAFYAEIPVPRRLVLRADRTNHSPIVLRSDRPVRSI